MTVRRGELILVTLGTLGVGAAWVWLARGRGAGGEWPGVDEAVVARFVQESGTSPSRPLLDWVRGDALLFAFLMAGLVAGFVLGFFARSLSRTGKGQPS